jgi:hypothetical protein
MMISFQLVLLLTTSDILGNLYIVPSASALRGVEDEEH